jgi:hypothetical protein
MALKANILYNDSLSKSKGIQSQINRNIPHLIKLTESNFPQNDIF